MTVLLDLTPALADRYQLQREIGSGGMATVYLAHDLRHDRQVAIKVLRPELGAVLGAERFLAEIRVTANLQHPNLLPLFDSGEAAGFLYYVMPYIEGESLRARLDRETQLPVDDVARVVKLLAGALDYAHARGVVHRDLKPENILLQAGQPMIADFGIALAVSNAGGERITQTGMSLGTPYYMSPEQATGERTVDARSDQYSLAAVTYEMLAGETPHAGPNMQAIIARLMTERPRSVRQTRPSVPVAMDEALSRALSKVPADRFPSCGAFAAAFADHSTTASLPVGATSTGAPPSRSKWMRAVAAGVALLAGGGWYVTRDTAAPATILQSDRVYIADATGAAAGSGLEATAAGVNDALVRGVGALPWAKPSSPSTGLSVATDPVAAARAVRAASTITTVLFPAGDSVQLQVRVLDTQTGVVLRAPPSVRVAKNASADALQRAVEPAIVATGFVTSPRLGAATLPSGSLPGLEIFRAYESSYVDFMATDTVARTRMVSTLRDVVGRDTSFTQARLWLGFVYGWYAYFSRYQGGAERADSVIRWSTTNRQSFTTYEAALADFSVIGVRGLSDKWLDAARRVASLTPNSPIARNLPSVLLDVNRPNEAHAMQAEAIRVRGDSATAFAYQRIADTEHFLGDHKAELAHCQSARRKAPGDALALQCELVALAALGDTTALLKELDDLPSSSNDESQFSFTGNVLLTLGQELQAHGSPQVGARILQRALRWFESNPAAVARSSNVGLRYAITLDAVGREEDALKVLRDALTRSGDDSRLHGYVARLLAKKHDAAGLATEMAWLRALPSEKLQGSPLYEIAAVTANLGPSHWTEATELLEQSLLQGQGFGLRRRLHYFGDWVPLHEFPAFKKVLEPRG
ncbi:MAG: protein kinase [Gemmatimonadota bacterium]|nr:protein kinase [Gemmatimonadota bacterium]